MLVRSFGNKSRTTITQRYGSYYADSVCDWIFEHKTSSTGDRKRPLPYYTSRTAIVGNYSMFSNQRYFDHSVGGYVDRVNSEVGRALRDYYSNGALYNPVLLPGISGNFSTEYLQMPISLNQTLSNRILMKLAKDDVGIGAMIAELSETSAQLASLGMALYKVYTTVKNGQFNATAKALGLVRTKAWFTPRETRAIRKFGINTIPTTRRNDILRDQLASRWLEVNFGVIPLVSDVRDLMNLMKNELLPSLSLRVATSSQMPIKGEKEKFPYGTAYYVDSNYSYNLIGRKVVTFGVNDAERVAQKALGLHSKSAAIYEGVPFSWLLDYVINVGDILYMLTAVEGLYFIHGCTSVRCLGDIHEVKYLRNPDRGPNGTWLDTYQRAYYLNSFRRFVDKAFPTPHLEFKLNKLSLTKVTNVAAVIAQLTR